MDKDHAQDQDLNLKDLRQDQNQDVQHLCLHINLDPNNLIALNLASPVVPLQNQTALNPANPDVHNQIVLNLVNQAVLNQTAHNPVLLVVHHQIVLVQDHRNQVVQPPLQVQDLNLHPDHQHLHPDLQHLDPNSLLQDLINLRVNICHPKAMKLVLQVVQHHVLDPVPDHNHSPNLNNLHIPVHKARHQAHSLLVQVPDLNSLHIPVHKDQRQAHSHHILHHNNLNLHTLEKRPVLVKTLAPWVPMVTTTTNPAIPLNIRNV